MRRPFWLIVMLPLTAAGQNSAVPWSCFHTGVGRAAGAEWAAPSLTGQTFVTPSTAGNTRLVPGFLAHPALHHMAVTVRQVDANPAGFALDQNYPNPFNGQTRIGYRVQPPHTTQSGGGAGSGEWVRLKVYDILGREVATLVDRPEAAGEHAVMFDATGLATGTYFCRIAAGPHVSTKRMMVMK